MYFVRSAVRLIIGLVPKPRERTVNVSLRPLNPVFSWAIGFNLG